MTNKTLSAVFAGNARELIREKLARTIVPGQDYIPVTGKIIDEDDIMLGLESVLDGWLTAGRFANTFERELARFFGSRFSLLVNSGSSANLLAFYTLTSPKLGDRALQPGDEIISVAAGFPTTINPVLQFGCVPVFLDIDIPTYNIKAEDIEAAISPKTKAIFIAHTLGNPFNLDVVMEVAKKYQLWVIEDDCDSLGATYRDKKTGSFGDLATVSFYPAHHITMGEGGAVFTDKPRLKRVIESMRDWGRDCWCAPGMDNTCGKRFARQLGSLPKGYDHKFTYGHAGYNLKITDMQAAVGLAQLDHLSGFIAARKQNFAILTELLQPLEHIFILPKATPKSDPSWFGFPITIRPDANLDREALVRFLNDNKIGTRLLFGGNLLRQPYMKGRKYRVVGDLENADLVTMNTFWVGLFPGLTQDHLAYTADKISEFVSRARGRI